MKPKKNIVILSGPTASFKTKWAINLAQIFGGEVVNFDSLLFYRELNIVTAKPTAQECGGIPHHLINDETCAQPLNAFDYQAKARAIINAHGSSAPLYLVGGSGFYLQALLYGMYESTTPSKAVLDRSQQLYETQGIAPFLGILEQSDRPSFELYHANDHYRIRRAVEHFWMTGEAFSDSRLKFARQLPLDWNVIHLHLDLPKDEHWALIQERTAQMIEEGAVEEIESLLKSGLTGLEKPMLSIGAKEIQQYLRGEITSLDALKEAISVSTRQLAKAQRTWFNRIEGKACFHPLQDAVEIISAVDKFLC